ncbi:MAG TPA: type II secretion system protein GspH [Verrucomicrobiales bacterium]|nr:type II secretion system protein GspH [Verrucomicrobiales bacterium]
MTMRLRIPHQQRASGFTLIELVVVLVLMAVLTAMIIPEMRGTLEGELLRSTSRELVRGLSLAHSQSITVNQQHRFVIDSERREYRVERFARSLDEGSGFSLVRDVPGARGGLNERVTIEYRPPEAGGAMVEAEADQFTPTAPQDAVANPGGTVIRFFPDGTADGGELHLRDRQGFGLALRLNPITARVQAVELERRRAE